ncbi:MAG: OmpA family protein [Bacteroidota bacterium]
MKKSVLIIILVVFSAISIYSQELKNIKNATDCKSAIEISTISKFGPTNPPKELKVKSTDNPFERSQHPTWYKFKIVKDGVLLFDIIPINPNDNYDFLLYKINSKNYCQNIKSGKNEAIRSNLARADLALQGKTGLSITGKPECYSKGIDVKKGEQYILALNNMYKGKGHTLVFKYLENFIVKGTISDFSTSESLKAKVFWTNLRTNETTNFASSNKQGNYELKVSVSTEAHRFPNYLLWAYDDKYYISDTIIASRNVSSLQSGHFNFKLHKLKKGNNDFLPKIYFDPNLTNICSGSFANLESIYRLMEQNKQMEIILEGHSNGFYPSNNVDKILSEDRAEKIKDWLVNKGLDANRIGTRGLGSNKMVFPYAENEKEESGNRRVEIFIVKF